MQVNIKPDINAAWVQACADYKAGKIVTEATLQASLYRHLIETLDNTYTVFCEPLIKLDDKSFKPDLLILKGESIVAALELKFVPHHFAEDKYDIKKLSVYAQYPEAMKIELNPESGKYSGKLHAFAKDCVFVFAAIAQHNAAAVLTEYAKKNASKYSCLKDKFLHLAHPVGGTSS